jgi:hypothetical protein
MSITQLHPEVVKPEPSQSWDRPPNRRHVRLLRRYERQCQVALRRGRGLLERKTLGTDQGRLLGRMQAVAQAYDDYHAALNAIIRLQLL